MAYRAMRQRGFYGLIDNAVNVCRPHNALVVNGDIHEQFVEINVLLIIRANEVVEREPGDGEGRLAIVILHL